MKAAEGLGAERLRFNEKVAPVIAKKLDLPPRVRGRGYSDRFAFFADDERLAIVAGAQEGDHVELALAYAVRLANGRPLTLVLPMGQTKATAQRVPWLRPDAQPTIYVHKKDGTPPSPFPLLSRAATVEALKVRLKGQSPADELTQSMAPAHLGAKSQGVWELVEWATNERLLDHGHRSGERSWHVAGQRVLSLRRTASGISITVGIHYSGAKKPVAVVLKNGALLSETQFEEIRASVNAAIQERLSGPPPIHRADEHWLQAVIRRDPAIVGVEQPALRELPAWRPRDSTKEWGRAFIDLLGLDGHGDIQIVETKLADNADDLLVLQGLDYFVWAQAYEHALRVRLGAANGASFELHYVLGASGKSGKFKVSACTKPLAEALDPSAVRWRFQTVRNWYPAADRALTNVLSDVSAPFEVLTDGVSHEHHD